MIFNLIDIFSCIRSISPISLFQALEVEETDAVPFIVYFKCSVDFVNIDTTYLQSYRMEWLSSQPSFPHQTTPETHEYSSKAYKLVCISSANLTSKVTVHCLYFTLFIPPGWELVLNWVKQAWFLKNAFTYFCSKVTL